MNKRKLSIVFAGTPEFACPSLKKVADNEKLVAIITQPDKPAGRGKKLFPPAVKLMGERKGIPVYQPKNLENPAFLKKISSLQPDLLVIVAFGRILPKIVLDIPRVFSINLHPSLLPKYRGPAPIRWVLIKGEEQTGITIQRVRETIDTGEIILQSKVFINLKDTYGTLSKRLSQQGAEILIEAIHLIKENNFKLKPQKGKISFAPKITSDTSKINWKTSAQEIHNLVRGLNPSPRAFTTFLKKESPSTIKIWKTSVWKETLNRKKTFPGTIIKIQKEKGFIVQTEKENLLIEEIQLPGKTKISAYDFIKGYHIKKGFLLGV